MAETTDTTTEPVTIDGITEGERFKLAEPNWRPHINGGPHPKGFTYNGFSIPWNSPVTAHADDTAPDVYEEGGTIYVHCRLIAEMRSGDNKQFRKLPS